MICLVCEPVNLEIVEPINSFQLEALDDPPDRSRALAEHAGLVRALERLGVEVVRLAPIDGAPYQVFTRDAVIGGLGRPILATPKEPLRRGELEAVRRALGEAALPFVEGGGACLEGGDVVVHGREVFVGVGDRTEPEAAAWLREHCSPGYEVRVLEMKPGFLHLDMVFNVVAPDRSVYFPAAFAAAAARELADRFPRRLEIGAEEQRARSTNFLPLGETAVVASTTIAAGVKELIAACGKELHLVELDEIQKCGGSVRCSTCLV